MARGLAFSWFQGGLVTVFALTIALWHRRELTRLLLAFVEDNELGLLLSTGIACSTAQCVLWLLFTFALGDGPWRREPGFTAHQVVCFPLMIYLTYVGLSHFHLAAPAPFNTPVSRVFEPHPVGTVMTKIVLGELLLWDIPSGLLVKSLREPLMVAHHVGMALTAAIGLYPGLNSYYALFFYGVIELSGIFLCVVDLFHPKHPAWCAYLESAPALRALNDAARLAFVAAYFSVRAALFPYVVATQVLPDAYALLQLPEAERRGVHPALICVIPVFGVLFSLLQCYWGTLLYAQVVKVLRGGGGRKDQSKQM